MRYFNKAINAVFAATVGLGLYFIVITLFDLDFNWFGLLGLLFK